MGRVRAYRRIGTVNEVEVHRGTKAVQLGVKGKEGIWISEAPQ